MRLFTKKITPLKIEEIATILRSYLQQRGDISLDVIDSATTEILAGTPQWTLVQLVDNYLLAVFSPEAYKILLEMDNSIGDSVLPPKPSSSYGFCLDFFMFSLVIRNLSEDAEAEIMKMVTKASGEFSTNLKGIQANLAILVNVLIPQIQLYELNEASLIIEGNFEAQIKDSIKDNNNLLNFYLSQRPDIAKLLQSTETKSS